LIEDLGEFVINLPLESQVYEVDYCGTRSGKDVNKWDELGLTREKAVQVEVPLVKEFPISVECKVVQKYLVGSHGIYFGEVQAVHVDEGYNPDDQYQLVYASGRYYSINGAPLKKHGYSLKGK
jgi:flavin reductase (DIM6/NTAB) family NADH-FMN oxidoreductase RutF